MSLGGVSGGTHEVKFLGPDWGSELPETFTS